MEKQKKNLGSVAFLPLIVFLVCYVGCGITFTLMGADDPFGKFPRHVALLAGCAVALLLNRSMDVKDKLNIMTTNMGNSGVMMIVLIYLMAFCSKAYSRLLLLLNIPKHQASFSDRIILNFLLRLYNILQVVIQHLSLSEQV